MFTQCKWNAKFSHKKNVSVCKNGYSNNEDTADLFAKSFEKVFTHNSEHQNEELHIDFERKYCMSICMRMQMETLTMR